MTQLEFANKVAALEASLSASAETAAESLLDQWHSLILNAGKEVGLIRGQATQVVIQLADAAEALIQTEVGSITINGQQLSTLPAYQQLAAAVQKALGEQPGQAVVATQTVVPTAVGTSETTSAAYSAGTAVGGTTSQSEELPF